jgi:hypothetical protein
LYEYIYDILIKNKTIDNIFYIHYTSTKILNNDWPWKIKCTWIVGWIVNGALLLCQRALGKNLSIRGDEARIINVVN